MLVFCQSSGRCTVCFISLFIYIFSLLNASIIYTPRSYSLHFYLIVLYLYDSYIVCSPTYTHVCHIWATRQRSRRLGPKKETEFCEGRKWRLVCVVGSCRRTSQTFCRSFYNWFVGRLVFWGCGTGSYKRPVHGHVYLLPVCVHTHIYLIYTYRCIHVT